MLCIIKNETVDIIVSHLLNMSPNETEITFCPKTLPKNFNDVVKIFRAIPAQVRNLSLVSNGLGKNELGEHFPEILEALPKSLEILDLRKNNLSFCIDELANGIRSFPKLTRLYLGSNQFSNVNLSALFLAIPRTVIDLELDDNCLGLMPTSELKRTLPMLPNTLRNLDLSANQFKLENLYNFLELLHLMHPLRNLYLDKNLYEASTVTLLLQTAPATRVHFIENFAASHKYVQKWNPENHARFFCAGDRALVTTFFATAQRDGKTDSPIRAQHLARLPLELQYEAIGYALS